MLNTEKSHNLRERALEVQAVHVRLLIDLRVLPRVDDREPPAVGRQFEPFGQTRLRRPDTAAGRTRNIDSGMKYT